MKKTSCGSYIHLLCQTFTPELSWDDNLRTDLKNLDKERKQLKCEICKTENGITSKLFFKLQLIIIAGACIQCNDKNCVSATHPSCAYRGDWQMLTRYNTIDDCLIREIFCPDHEQSASYLQEVADSKKAITIKEHDLDLSVHDTPLSDLKRKPDLKVSIYLSYYCNLHYTNHYPLSSD